MALSKYVKPVIFWLRGTSADSSTSEGRARERWRRVLVTAAAAFASRGIGILTLLVTVPLTLHYLGQERYGLWMTISSVIALLGFADLGLGNGLVNALSAAHGRDDHAEARALVSNAFFLLAAIAAALGILFFVNYPWISWADLFNVRSALAAEEAGAATAVLLVTVLLNLPLGVVQRIQLGYQEGFTNGLWAAVSNLMALVAVVAVIQLRGSLPWLVLAVAGAPVLATAVNGFVLFRYRKPWLLPRPGDLSPRTMRTLGRIGAAFFVLQITGVIIFASDNIVIARMLGPDAVTEYAVPARLFGLLPLVLGILLCPLWPAYGEALARGDGAWVRRALKQSLVLALGIGGTAAVALTALGPAVLALWVGPGVTPGAGVLTGLCAQVIVVALATPLTMVLNGANVMRFQVAAALAQAATCLPLKIAFAHLFGVGGVPWATAVTHLACWVVPVAVFLPALLALPARTASPAPTTC